MGILKGPKSWSTAHPGYINGKTVFTYRNTSNKSEFLKSVTIYIGAVATYAYDYHGSGLLGVHGGVKGYTFTGDPADFQLEAAGKSSNTIHVTRKLTTSTRYPCNISSCNRAHDKNDKGEYDTKMYSCHAKAQMKIGSSTRSNYACTFTFSDPPEVEGGKEIGIIVHVSNYTETGWFSLLCDAKDGADASNWVEVSNNNTPPPTETIPLVLVANPHGMVGTLEDDIYTPSPTSTPGYITAYSLSDSSYGGRFEPAKEIKIGQTLKFPMLPVTWDRNNTADAMNKVVSAVDDSHPVGADIRYVGWRTIPIKREDLEVTDVLAYENGSSTSAASHSIKAYKIKREKLTQDLDYYNLSHTPNPSQDGFYKLYPEKQNPDGAVTSRICDITTVWDGMLVIPVFSFWFTVYLQDSRGSLLSVLQGSKNEDMNQLGYNITSKLPTPSGLSGQFSGWKVLKSTHPQSTIECVRGNMVLEAVEVNVNTGLWIRNSRTSTWEHYRPQSKKDEVLGWDYSQSGWPWCGELKKDKQEYAETSDYDRDHFPQIWRFCEGRGLKLATWNYYVTVREWSFTCQPYIAPSGEPPSGGQSESHKHTPTAKPNVLLNKSSGYSHGTFPCGVSSRSEPGYTYDGFVGYFTQYANKKRSGIEPKRWALEWETSTEEAGHKVTTSVTKNTSEITPAKKHGDQENPKSSETGHLGDKRLKLKVFSRGSGWKDV